jgi:hypothetical protein
MFQNFHLFQLNPMCLNFLRFLNFLMCRNSQKYQKSLMFHYYH